MPKPVLPAPAASYRARRGVADPNGPGPLGRGSRALSRTLAIGAAGLASIAAGAGDGARAEVFVSTYASPALGEGGGANTHLIETPDGVVVFDPQRLLPEAERVVEIIGDREVLAVFASHPHTDHYGGLPVFAERFPKAPRLATPETSRAITKDANGFNAARRERHGGDFAARAELTAAKPTRTLEDGATLTFGGEDFDVAVFGPGHAADHAALHHGATGSLFVGDLVVNGYVPGGWVDAEAWLDQLEELRRRFPDAVTLHPGHGPSGAADRLIEAQIACLGRMRDEVAAALENDARVDADERARIVLDFETAYPQRLGAAGRDRRTTLTAAVDSVAAQLAGASAGPLQVHSYASQVNDVDSVNSHWFETGDGVVLIDAQRLLPEAKRALAHLRATTDAPVRAIVVTHAHTDHYGGLPVWTAAFPAAQIYADAATLDSIRSDGRGFIAMRNERHGGRFAGQDALTRAVADAEAIEAGETIAVGGAALAFDVLGPSEAAATVTVAVEDEDVAFVGDLVNVGAPAVPFEDVDGWLDQLDALAGRYDGDDRLYIGHGSSPAGVAAALEDDGVLDAAETGRVVFDLEAAWPFLQGVAGNTRREVLAFTAGRVAEQLGGEAEGEG